MHEEPAARFIAVCSDILTKLKDMNVNGRPQTGKVTGIEKSKTPYGHVTRFLKEHYLSWLANILAKIGLDKHSDAV
jgi:hypothetical protein